MTIRQILEQFFAAQTTNDERTLRSLLADDVEYSNVLNTYRSADEFVGALAGFNRMLQGIEVVNVVADGDRGAVLYDCKLPLGTLRTGWFVRVESGKLKHIVSVFDATEIRKAFAK